MPSTAVMENEVEAVEAVKAAPEVLTYASKLNTRSKLEQVIEREGRWDMVMRLNSNVGAMDNENWWQWREAIRLTNGGIYTSFQVTYIGLSKLAIPNHYLHISTVDPLKLSFTENPDKGKKDMQLRMAPGKYLKRFYPELSDHQIRDAVAIFNDLYGPGAPLLVAKTQAKIIEAMRAAASESCMAKMSNFVGHIHPAAIYESPDIEVLYVERDGKINGRTLANKKTKNHTRIYGDVARMQKALRREGYTQKVYALDGCRVARIKNENGEGHLMSYVDAGIKSGGGCINFKFNDDENYFTLCQHGGQTTMIGLDALGVTHKEPPEEPPEETHCCQHCEHEYDEEDMFYIDGWGNTCDDCRAREYTDAVYRIDGATKYFRDGDVVVLNDTAYWIGLDLTHFGFKYATEVSEWITEDEAVLDIFGSYQRSCDCTAVGTNSEGDSHYILTSVMHIHAKELFYLGNDKLFHVISEEYKQRGETVTVSLKDTARTHLPKYKMHIQKDLARNTARATLGFRLAPYTDTSDLYLAVMRVLLEEENNGRISYIHSVLKGSTTLASGQYKTMCEIFNVSLPKPVVAPPKEPGAIKWPFVAPTDRLTPSTWREAYIAAQDAGVQFSHTDDGEHWSSGAGACNFRDNKDQYRLTDNTPGYNRREALKNAAVRGILFECINGDPVNNLWQRPSTHWEFGDRIQCYRVYDPETASSGTTTDRISSANSLAVLAHTPNAEILVAAPQPEYMEAA